MYILVGTSFISEYGVDLVIEKGQSRKYVFFCRAEDPEEVVS